MKTILNLFALFCLAFACTDHPDQRIAPIVSSDRMLKLDSHEDLSKTLSQVSKMNESEFKAWESKNSFVSMRTVINQAHAELELIKTQKDFSEFLSKYEDVFSFSDSTLTPKIQIEALKSIVNRNGLYEINGHLVKVTENKILSASKDKYESLVSVKNSDPSELSRLGIQVHDMDIQDINLLSDGRTK